MQIAGKAVLKLTVEDGAGGTKEITITRETHGVSVHLEGTGCMEMDECAPIYIEFYAGQPRVLVWDDINNPEPTTIELDKALESNRRPDAEAELAYYPEI